MATTFSAEEPERLRGPQHGAAVCDELGAWSRPETWDMLQFGLRLGRYPRCLVATTPRPTKLIRELLAREGRDVTVTRGSTYENRVNLAPGFFDQIIRKYEGTRLGRQELNAELLDDVPGALWSRARLEELRWPVYKSVPDLVRIVIAIVRRHRARTPMKPASSLPGRDAGGCGYVLADR
jgi:phage terminase large subunit-like protein